VKPARPALFLLFSVAFSGILQAAPVLRLSSATVGPVSIAAGAAAPNQTVEAFNAGDGNLSLKLASSVAWISPSAGAPRACLATQAAATCIPLQFALDTARLPAGIQTGIVTVTDPNAVDAPQTITVTVQVGGGVPSAVDAWVAPGSSRDILFSTNSYVYGRATTADGGNWLALALDGVGSFRFVYPYRVQLQPPADMAEGTYNGSLAVGGSVLAAENKTVPVTMRVTTRPIAGLNTTRLEARVAQGASPQAVYLPVSNLGQGSLTVQSATAAGGSGIEAAAYGSGALVTFTPGPLAPGTYSGTLTFTTDAANALDPIPVDFTVVPKDAPLIFFDGVLDNATYVPGDPVARGGIVIAKGEQLSFAPLTLGAAPPLDTKIGGAQVLVNGTPAPMFYSIYNQLAFQMPFDTAAGSAVVQVVRDGQPGNKVSVQVAARAPRILMSGVSDYGIVTLPDYSRPMPAGSFPGVNTRPAKPGDVLTFWCIGLGPVSPAVAAGAPAPAAEPFARLTENPVVTFGGAIGGIRVDPIFAGLTPTLAGLYQVNVVVPEGVQRGKVYVRLDFVDAGSNVVAIAIE
jgi:uncharacterized protein (TIGR03437 family)